MTPIKVLIVEDEILIAETIRMYLNERGHTVTDIAISYDEAVAAYKDTQPDVILLDVRLYGEKSGIDFANYLIDNQQKTPYIYLTSQFDKRIVENAMTTKPHGYLTKPIQKETLWTTTELAHYQAMNEDEDDDQMILNLYDGTTWHLIDQKDILYINANHVYIHFHTLNHPAVMVRNSISQIIEELDPELFIQSHRGHIINVTKVESYNNNFVIINNEEIPLSRSKKSEVISKIKATKIK